LVPALWLTQAHSFTARSYERIQSDVLAQNIESGIKYSSWLQARNSRQTLPVE